MSLHDVSSHAEAQGLFPAQQSAYRPFHSTESAIICVHNDLVHAIDDRKAALLVLLDLRAAIDTFDHDILLSILETRFAPPLIGYVHTWPVVLKCSSTLTNSLWATQCYALCCRVPCLDLSASSHTRQRHGAAQSVVAFICRWHTAVWALMCQAFEGSWEHVWLMWINGVPLDVYN